MQVLLHEAIEQFPIVDAFHKSFSMPDLIRRVGADKNCEIKICYNLYGGEKKTHI